MKLSVLFLISAIIYAVFALANLLVPAQVLSIYGVTEATAPMLILTRLVGAGDAGVTVLCWLLREQANGPTLRAVLMSLFVWNVLGALVFLLAVLQTTVNAAGWSGVVIYALMAVGFGYYTFIKPASSS